MPTNDVFEMGWMVAKSDTDLDLNEEFFAVRKRNLSNQERLNQIRNIMRARQASPHLKPGRTMAPSMRSEAEWADYAGIERDQPPPPPPPPPPPGEAEPEPEPEVDEAEVEIVDEEPEPTERPGPDEDLEETLPPNLEMIVQPRPRRAVDYDEDGEDADDSDIDYGESEEVVADIPEAETPPTEVEPESFVESPVNTTEQMENTEGQFISAFHEDESEITGGMPLETARQFDAEGKGYLHTFKDGMQEFYYGITQEEYDALKSEDWSVVENPFANPFFDTSAFSIRKNRPRGFVNPTPSPPMEEIQKEEKPPELNGFQTKKEDDLSLLPSSMLIKDNSIGDDLSLLPTGWKHD